MKLLIDIPEHIYEHAKETTEDSRDEFDAMRAIANGTQQESRSENPNTCSDAISRQAAKRALEDRFMELQKRHNDKRYETNYCLNTILELPSVTPQQRTGRWIYIPERRLVDETDEGGVYITDHRCTCSECGGDFGFSKMSDAYCKYCGAKMEVEE